MEPIELRRWAIAEGCIPSQGSPSQSSLSHRAHICHDTARILNASDPDARVRVTVFFVDRETVGPCDVTVTTRRTLHLRFNDVKDPASIPCGTDYASAFESDVPIVLQQHTRLDSRHAELKSAFNDVLMHRRDSTLPDGSGRNTEQLGESTRI